MPSQLTALVITAAVILAAFAAMIIRRKHLNALHFEKTVKHSWGKPSPRLFVVPDIGEIRHLSDREKPAVDDITASDTDLDRVFGLIAEGSMSSPGAEVLYDWLRHPAMEEESVGRRIELQDYFAAHEEERLKLQEILHEIASLKEGSFSHVIAESGSASPIGKNALFTAAGIATFVSILLLFFYPVAALIALAVLLIINYYLHMGMRSETAKPLAGFIAILRLLSAADAVADGAFPALEEERRELKELASHFRDFRRGSFFVTSGSYVGNGAGDALMQYVNLLFHVNLIKYDRMLLDVRGHEEEAVRLLKILGGLDAVCASASYRASLPFFCRPEWIPAEEGAGSAQVRYEASDLVHPLLDEPVPNSICADRPVLLTGSNASGKSTFLKSVALSAIMAQSLGFAAARKYKAPFFRIFSSMAQRDNLMGGESYFVVEIRSLKRIFDAVHDGGAPVLAFADEILRGTNTVERIASSSKVLEAMAVPGAVLFAATHDVELTFLLKDTWRNMHFSETVKKGDICFDYQLKEGRAGSGNAIRLLQANGYPQEVTDAAREMAEHFTKTGEWK